MIYTLGNENKLSKRFLCQPCKTLVLIPTYNEVENIDILLKKIFDLSCIDFILIVDDGSTDGTIEKLNLLRNKYSKLFVYQRNKKNGLGSALVAGFCYALNHFQFDNIITMDADLSHDPNYIPLLLSSPADIAVGSRYVAGGKITGWSFKRKLTSFAGNFLAQNLLSLNIRDVTSGYRRYSFKAVKTIAEKATCNGFEFQIEALWLVTQTGLNIHEIPIHFINRVYGSSKLRTFYEARAFLIFLFKAV